MLGMTSASGCANAIILLSVLALTHAILHIKLQNFGINNHLHTNNLASWASQWTSMYTKEVEIYPGLFFILIVSKL
jgi:hypothetical protein